MIRVDRFLCNENNILNHQTIYREIKKSPTENGTLFLFFPENRFHTTHPPSHGYRYRTSLLSAKTLKSFFKIIPSMPQHVPLFSPWLQIPHENSLKHSVRARQPHHPMRILCSLRYCSPQPSVCQDLSMFPLPC
jgi:hypothetical protein